MDPVPVCLNQVHFRVAFLYQATIQTTGSVAFQVCRLPDPEVSPFFIFFSFCILYSVFCLFHVFHRVSIVSSREYCTPYIVYFCYTLYCVCLPTFIQHATGRLNR